MPKTLKLKAPEPAAAIKPVAEGGSPAGASDGIYVSKRHRNPAESSAVRRENWTWAAILAIVSTALVVGTLALEVVDYSL